MLILLLFILALGAGGALYLRHPRFGAVAKGERLSKMKKQSNYKNGTFENLQYTPALSEGVSPIDIFRHYFLAKKVNTVPKDLIPVIKSDLHSIALNKDVFLWMGHSSYFIQLDGKKILVDPVFSKYASPVRILVRAFNSTYKYSEKDIPEIDLLFITHDHWDHLDYNTFMQLKNRVKHIVTGLGVGAHLEKWGYPANQITELYWWESVTIDNFQITATPSRHFSGRTFKRNTTLWSSFVLKGSKQIFLGGDSGYGTHFQKIGEEFGPFDFAILENGQYDALWNTVHMFPEEAVQAAKDLQAKHAIPVHSGKFALAKHPWYEPLARFSKEAKTQALKSLTPSVGQLLDLDNPAPPASWWEKIN